MTDKKNKDEWEDPHGKKKPTGRCLPDNHEEVFAKEREYLKSIQKEQ